MSALRQAADRGELHRITRPGEIDARLDELRSTDWVVYTKAYLSHPDTVVDYLGRYSRKTALNDRRIVGIEDNTVRLRYKDYRDQDRTKVMDLEGEELIRRFLLHILPSGFMRSAITAFSPTGAEQPSWRRYTPALEQQRKRANPRKPRTKRTDWRTPSNRHLYAHAAISVA